MTDSNYPSAIPQSQPPKKNNAKNLMIGLLAAGLLGTWGYFLYDKNTTTEEIQQNKVEKVAALSSLDSLKLEYSDALQRLDTLTGTNNNLQGQLSEKNSQISKLKNEIAAALKKSKLSAAEVVELKRKIATLNDTIASLEADNARLTGENQQLTATNTQLSQDIQVKDQEIATRVAEKQELEKTVDVASTFAASNIQITPVNERRNGKEKTTSTAKKVDKLVVSFDVENRISKSGPADLYIMVTAPDGKVVSSQEMGSGTLPTRTDGDITYTSKVAINYEQGTRKKVEFPMRQADFLKGDYRIDVYHNGFKIGQGVRSLKKGGLFG